MSEVINIHTRKPWQQVTSANAIEEVSTQSLISFIKNGFFSKRNDSYRKNISLKGLHFSNALKDITNELEIYLLKEICDKVRFSNYSEINFWSISDEIFSEENRENYEKDHSGGLIQTTTQPIQHIVWIMDKPKSKIKLFTAEEFFNSDPL